MFLKKESHVYGIESKFLELLSKKEQKFSESYITHDFKNADEYWLNSLNHYFYSKKKYYFNAAQIIKHYLGLSNCYEDFSKTIVYLFYEPSNYNQFNEYIQHRAEIIEFISLIDKSSTGFIYMSYNELWDQWQIHGLYPYHIKKLHSRYKMDF